MSRWFRHYAGMMRDDKLVRVAIKSKQSIERVLWVWGAILESAAEIDDGGRYDVDAAEVAYFLRADEADIFSVLAAFAEAGRVAEGRVVKWGDRQFQSDRSAARVAAHRERKRGSGRDGNEGQQVGNGDVTLQERHGNSPETETETETEEETTSVVSISAKRAERQAQSAAFDDFWQAYPRREGKQHAAKAWARATKAKPADLIISAAKRYAKAKADTDRQFIKQPATWLNAGCWEDEIPDAGARPRGQAFFGENAT